MDTTTEMPEDAASRSELRRALERKIDELPEQFRTAFMLREVEEMSAEEAAECLGIPVSTVRTRAFRARALLRESLAREMDIATINAFGFAGDRCNRIVARVLARLKTGGAENVKKLEGLKGADFDKAYIAHEVAYHQQVLDAIDNTLVPNAKNAELKGLIVKVRPAFVGHLEHAKQIQSKLGKAT